MHESSDEAPAVGHYGIQQIAGRGAVEMKEGVEGMYDVGLFALRILALHLDAFQKLLQKFSGRYSGVVRFALDLVPDVFRRLLEIVDVVVDLKVDPGYAVRLHVGGAFLPCRELHDGEQEMLRSDELMAHAVGY